jgi:predicted transcriptional regulator
MAKKKKQPGPVAVRIEPDIARQLRQCSKVTGVSQRRLVQQALEGYLQRRMLVESRDMTPTER